MKIIYNKFLPRKGFAAMNICGLIFARKEFKPLGIRTINHECIHTRQWYEMLIVGFLIWYGIEWLIKFCKYRNGNKAYRNLSLEREAYANDHNMNYLKERKLFAWWKYIQLKN